MAQNIALITMIVAITMVALYGGAMAQSSGCTTTLISLSPCLNYISGNTTTPSSGCCSQLASVVQSQPECLCQVLNGDGSSLGLSINQTHALALPSACNVQTPPISRCNAPSPGNTPLSGSNKVPSTDSGSSDASSIRFTIIHVVFSLLVSVYSMAF